jgi:hypothetical protein
MECMQMLEHIFLVQLLFLIHAQCNKKCNSTIEEMKNQIYIH